MRPQALVTAKFRLLLQVQRTLRVVRQSQKPAPPRQEKEKGAEPLPPLAELLQLKARQLKAMCTERGLPSTGKRQELADRLHQHEQSRKEDGKSAKKAQRAREKGKEKEAEAQRQAEEAKAKKKKRSPLEAFMKKGGE